MNLFQVDDRPRRLRRLLISALAVAGLVGVTALLTTHLTTRTVEDRLHAELAHTAGLLSGSGFPLGDAALERVAEFIQADVVAVDGSGDLLATNLDGPARASFAAALESGSLPPVRGVEPSVTRGTLDARPVTVGVAPLEGGRGGVYVVYPEDLLAAQTRSAWVPVTGVAVVAALLALFLGAWSERTFQRSRQEALLRLLAAVGHEVRNPLGAIGSLARSVRRRVGGDVDTKPLDMIEAEAERLTLLVEGLRAIGLPVRTLRRATDPDAAADAVVGLLSHQLEHRRVQVERGWGEPASVSADPAHVRQVVLNLLLNAADAMPRGGVVRLISRVVDDRWELSVEDDGPGVDPLVAPRLFSAFVSTKAKGLGVGLFLSQRLVQANEGSLTLDEGFGPGARFVLSWPLVDASVGSITDPQA